MVSSGQYKTGYHRAPCTHTNDIRTEWDLHIAISPSSENLARAAQALYRFLSQYPFSWEILLIHYDDVDYVKSYRQGLSLLQKIGNDSLPADIDPRGTEVKIHIPANTDTNTLKTFILGCWHHLIENRVLCGQYYPTHQFCELVTDGFPTPFSYTDLTESNKPYGNLFSRTKNEVDNNPFRDIVLTHEDCASFETMSSIASGRDKKADLSHHADYRNLRTRVDIAERNRALLTTLLQCSIAAEQVLNPEKPKAQNTESNSATNASAPVIDDPLSLPIPTSELIVQHFEVLASEFKPLINEAWNLINDLVALNLLLTEVSTPLCETANNDLLIDNKTRGKLTLVEDFLKRLGTGKQRNNDGDGFIQRVKAAQNNDLLYVLGYDKMLPKITFNAYRCLSLCHELKKKLPDEVRKDSKNATYRQHMACQRELVRYRNEYCSYLTTTVLPTLDEQANAFKEKVQLIEAAFAQVMTDVATNKIADEKKTHALGKFIPLEATSTLSLHPSLRTIQTELDQPPAYNKDNEAELVRANKLITLMGKIPKPFSLAVFTQKCHLGRLLESKANKNLLNFDMNIYKPHETEYQGVSMNKAIAQFTDTDHRKSVIPHAQVRTLVLCFPSIMQQCLYEAVHLQDRRFANDINTLLASKQLAPKISLARAAFCKSTVRHTRHDSSEERLEYRPSIPLLKHILRFYTDPNAPDTESIVQQLVDLTQSKHVNHSNPAVVDARCLLMGRFPHIVANMQANQREGIFAPLTKPQTNEDKMELDFSKRAREIILPILVELTDSNTPRDNLRVDFLMKLIVQLAQPNLNVEQHFHAVLSDNPKLKKQLTSTLSRNLDTRIKEVQSQLGELELSLQQDKERPMLDEDDFLVKNN